MPLDLNYRINEGINVSKDKEEGYKESIDVIVRDINLLPYGIKVDFELRDLLHGNSESISLFDGQEYAIMPFCNVQVPEDPLRAIIRLYGSRIITFGKNSALCWVRK